MAHRTVQGMADLSDDFLDELMRELEDNLGIAEPAYVWACDRGQCDGQPHAGYDYKHARTKQRRPVGDWFIWLLLCGRGFGKTRTGSEAFLDMVLEHPVDVDGIPTEWLIAGPDYGDTVKLLFEGVSSLKHSFERRGIKDKKLHPDATRWYLWNKQDKLITLSTGQRIVMQYAEGNDNLGRGGNWAGVWLDELGTYKNKLRQAWDESLLFSIRAVLPGGWRPRIMITTTPKTSAKEAFHLLWELVNDPDESTVVTVGTTWENEANIAPQQISLWKRMFPKGTRSHEQELNARLMKDVDGALFSDELLSSTRVDAIPSDERVVRRCIMVDPATTSGPNSDYTGIVAETKTMRRVTNEAGRTVDEPHLYLHDELRLRVPANDWAKQVLDLAWKYQCDIAVETDQGGEAWKTIIRQVAKSMGKPCPVVHHRRARELGDKATRANGLMTGFYNGQAHIVGRLPHFEEEATTWVPEQTRKSPDVLDAGVHGWHFLMPTGPVGVPVSSAY